MQNDAGFSSVAQDRHEHTHTHTHTGVITCQIQDMMSWEDELINIRGQGDSNEGR